MIELTSFLLKHLYELMADSDQTDLDSLMLLMAQNQLPDLICDTIIELLAIFVSVALIWILLSLSEFCGDGLSCHIISAAGCPSKVIEASY